MDDRGYWHGVGKAEESPTPGMTPSRSVFSAEIGSTVEVEKIPVESGRMLCKFERAEKNKVSLSPMPGEPVIPLRVGEKILLTDGADKGVPAQVWQQIGGMLIIRTLPLG